MTPLFSLGSSHVKVVGTLFLDFFKGGKQKKHVSCRFKRQALRLIYFPLIINDGAFFFFFSFTPRPFYEDSFFFSKEREKKPFLFVFSPDFFSTLPLGGKIFKTRFMLPF